MSKLFHIFQKFDVIALAQFFTLSIFGSFYLSRLRSVLCRVVDLKMCIGSTSVDLYSNPLLASFVLYSESLLARPHSSLAIHHFGLFSIEKWRQAVTPVPPQCEVP